MKDLTFQIFQQFLKTGLFYCVPDWITEIFYTVKYWQVSPRQSLVEPGSHNQTLLHCGSWEFCLLTSAEIFRRKWVRHNYFNICIHSPPNSAFDKICVSLEFIWSFFLPQTLCFWSGAGQRSRTRAFTRWRSRWQLPLSRSLLWM